MNIVCVKIGKKYPAELVNRLYRMCRKNITTPFNFFCYTDIGDGLDPNINIIDFVNHNLDVIVYNKLFLFSKQFSSLLPPGPCTYFDIDIVIKSNIDDIVSHRNNGLNVIRSFWREEHPRGYPTYHHHINSSCMTWNPPNTQWIWEHFMTDPEFFMTKYYWGMDSFLSYEFERKKIEMNHFPPRKFYSHIYGIDFDEHCKDDLPDTPHNMRGGYRKSRWVEEIKKIPVVLFNGPTEMRDYEEFAEYYSD